LPICYYKYLPIIKGKYKMEKRIKSEWFRLESPIGEPHLRWWENTPYYIERVVTSDGTIIWYGCETNWKKENGGNWTKLTTIENAIQIERYLPETDCGEHGNIFIECEIPVYEKLYQELGTQLL